MIKKIAILCLIFAYAAAIYAYSVVPEQYSTPEQYGDALIFSQRTGSELYAVDRQTKRDVWVWSSGERCIRTKPTIVGDVAYIWAGNTSDDSRACAINCKTGKSIWETPDSGWAFRSAEAFGDIVLFPVESYNNEIHAYERKTGKWLWTEKNCRMILLHKQTVLATKKRDTLVAMLDIKTGKELFGTEFKNEEFGEPQGSCNDAGVAVIGGVGGLIALNIPEKKVIWKRETGVKRVPVISGDALYLLLGWTSQELASNPQAIEICSLDTGREINRFELNTDSGTYFPALIFDSVIVVASGGSLIGIDSKALKEVWKLDVGVLYQIEKGIDSVYLGLGGPNLWQVDAKTGKILWSYGGGLSRSTRQLLIEIYS